MSVQERSFQVALSGAVGQPHEVKDHGIAGDPLHSLDVAVR